MTLQLLWERRPWGGAIAGLYPPNSNRHIEFVVTSDNFINKCIGDDTKAAARQSQTALRKQKKYGEKRFSIWLIEFLHPVMWHVALGSWQWIHQATIGLDATWHVALRWHYAIEFAQTSAILEFYFWYRFRPYHRSWHVILQSAPICEILSKSDHHRQKKCRFSRWRISATLDFRGPIMGSLKSPCTTSYYR